jgi:hypothetical protein
MGDRTLTLEFLIMDSAQPCPPDFLPCIPSAGLIHAPCNDSGNGLAHGFSRFLYAFLKCDTSRVDGILPEIGCNFKVLLTQFHPLIKLLVMSNDTETHQT